jgi:hypothetical protein
MSAKRPDVELVDVADVGCGVGASGVTEWCTISWIGANV